ncbi:hypothetical protein PF002_g18393 [Phytophthora fragariae]|uniref:Uncharacterized protein n=1 Tax=Phytophthora fragariae TaxID=53985 RepID=A0A6A3GK54_9STRA|nr:hypothetical protein PF011_g31002 [Phytophthora fragariae]KAE9063264.1 hypothetical protein PF007_g29607 [Phytophthora fragariae]KAE9069194.1 hypothetical protein PF006_g29630 [Phytophthora fragariae]KAE9211902.1 hypothetical protein PF002_g18393 [Phytophthora fragariae]KAE9266390.1 hypothetical protein PF001_g30499 [Phytophthora fragariae]
MDDFERYQDLHIPSDKLAVAAFECPPGIAEATQLLERANRAGHAIPGRTFVVYFNIWRLYAPEEPRPDNEVDTVDELHIDNELTTVNMPRAYIITLEEFMRDR